MRIVIDERVRKDIKALSKVDKGRVSGYIDLFGMNGFSMTSKYLKKVDSGLWELRPGDIRMLFGLVGTTAIFINMFKKKTQKTPKQDIETARSRLKEYQL